MFVVYKSLVYQDQIRSLSLKINEIPELIKKERATAINQSRIVVKGQIIENLFPLLAEHKGILDASDAKFIGMPIDYIVFTGYNKAKDDGVSEVEEIIFADVKTGNAKLSHHQESIKKAVEEKRIKWLTIRITDKGEINYE